MSSKFLPTGSIPPADESYATLYDARLYRDLTGQLNLPPTPFMLLFMGINAVGLYERRYIDGGTWWSFRKMVSALFPDIPVHTSTISPDGQVLTSVPERLVYERLKFRLPSDILILVHPSLPISGREFKADFMLKSPTGSMLWIEVVGSVGRNFRALNNFSEICKIKLIRKFNACQDAGIPLPFVVYADDVCDMARLDALIDSALSRLNSVAP